MTEPKAITVDGVAYVRADQKPAQDVDGMPFVIVRAYSAGVHAGYLKHRDGKEAVLTKSRRIHYWDGAASLSQMAMSGVSKPENCRFAVTVPEIILTEAIEVIPCTEEARQSIQEVPEWRV